MTLLLKVGSVTRNCHFFLYFFVFCCWYSPAKSRLWWRETPLLFLAAFVDQPAKSGALRPETPLLNFLSFFADFPLLEVEFKTRNSHSLYFLSFFPDFTTSKWGSEAFCCCCVCQISRALFCLSLLCSDDAVALGLFFVFVYWSKWRLLFAGLAVIFAWLKMSILGPFYPQSKPFRCMIFADTGLVGLHSNILSRDGRERGERGVEGGPCAHFSFRQSELCWNEYSDRWKKW